MRSAQNYGNKDTALRFFLQATAYQQTVRYSYHDLLAKIQQTANMLNGLGVGPKDTVSYVLPNTPQTYFSLYGAEIAGIANPINPLLEAHVIAEIMNAAKSKVLVTLAPFPKVDMWEKMATVTDKHDIRDHFAGQSGWLSAWREEIGGQTHATAHGQRACQGKGARLRQDPRPLPIRQAEQRRADWQGRGRRLFYTGGTAGTPKLAIHTHFNQVFDGWASGEMIDAKTEDINYLGLPLFHNYGAIAIGLASWVSGGSVVMGTPAGFRGEGVIPNFWKILDHHNVTIFSGVPTLFSTLLNVPAGDADLKRIKLATSGAAALPVEVANQFTAKTGIKILEGYGLTEATSVASVNPLAGELRIGSVGVRLPYQQVQAAQIEDGKISHFCAPK